MHILSNKDLYSAELETGTPFFRPIAPVGSSPMGVAFGI